ncbi:Golgin subfamily A member 7 [Basidiobolus ranarum]|uniref:Ras modification protein ERF4 n=1 Tax=Basidiobolus ranarum TaxID=34480 RepID=A0ABR2WW69_9FUNG
MKKESDQVTLERDTLAPIADVGGGALHRLSLKRMSTDFTNVVFSRLSYVFGENVDLSEDEEEDIDEATEAMRVPVSIPFSGKLRIERDYTLGEGCQFSMIYPTELVDKVSLPQFQESISKLNSILYRAESNWLRHSFDNIFACLSLYTTPMCFGTFYEKCMKEFDKAIEAENERVYAPVGLKLLNPHRSAYIYLEIEFSKIIT